MPIKLTIFIWRMRLRSILTRQSLSHCGITLNSIKCPICSPTVESTDHLFAGCIQLRDIWFCVAIWWDVQIPFQLSIDSILSCSQSTGLRGGHRKTFDAVIFTTLWCLWNFWNASIFGTVVPRKSFIFDDVVEKCYFWISNRCTKAKIGWFSWLHNPSIACNML